MSSGSISTTDSVSATLGRWERFLAALIVLLLAETTLAVMLRVGILQEAFADGDLRPIGLLAAAGLVILLPLLYAIVRVRSIQLEVATLVRQEQQSFKATRVLLDTTTEGIFRIDENGLCTMANRAAGEFLGCRSDELIGSKMHDLIHHTRSDGSAYPVEDCPIYKAMRDGKPRAVDDEIFWRKDGSFFSVAYSSRPIIDGDSPMGAVVSFKDIDERKRMEQAVRESYQRTLHFMEHLPIAVFVVDDTGQPVYSNNAARELLGVTADLSLEDSDLSQAYQVYVAGSNDLYEPERLPVLRALAGETVTTEDLEIHRPDGSVVPLEVWAGPIRDEEGKIRFGAAAFSDISVRRAAEAALRESEQAVRAASESAEQERQKAEQANRAKSEFLSRMSHELRTPLNGILGFSQLLEMDELSPDQRESAVQIRRAGRHLLDLINEVLDLARIEAGRLSMSLEPVAVSDLLKDCIDMITPLASEREIAIHFEADARASESHALVDRQRLKQIVLNLLSNAVKYNRPQGSIKLGCERAPNGMPNGMIEISVSDSGYGIAPDKLDRLFTAFDRLDVLDERAEGTGLGLALSRSLAQAMGGDIEATSEHGVGSRFVVRMPSAEAPEVMTTEEIASDVPAAAHGQPGTILYIEDNVANIRLIERILKIRPRLTLATSTDGESGLAQARELQPDLIVLDVNLPDINGDEVLSRLQLDPATADIPVIFLSADATERQISRLVKAGAAAYVTKPLDVQLFLSTVDRVLGEDAARARER